MKKQLLSAAFCLFGLVASSAQTLSTRQVAPVQSRSNAFIAEQRAVNYSAKEMSRELLRTARVATLTQQPTASDRSSLQAAPRKAYADNVLMGRPEGAFYSRGQLVSGGTFTSVLVAPFTDFKFYNYCKDYENVIWSIDDEVLEANEDYDLDYWMSKGSSSNSLYYAPTISIRDVSDQLVDFIQPVDSGLYTFNYLNTAKTGYYYFSNGSPFMTEDIPFDFDGDGKTEDYKGAGIRQFFLEKPMQPLALYDVYLPFYSTLQEPLKDGQTLKCIIRKVVVDDEGYYVPDEVLAEMEITADDLEEAEAIDDKYWEFAAVFANYTEDEFGTLTAAPVILDDMFVIDILGFDNEGTDIQLFAGYLHQDENEFYTNRTRATRIVLSNPDGSEFTGGTLAYYNQQAEDPYGYNAIIFLEGEMDGLYIDGYETQIAPVEGGESGADDENNSPVYLFTNYPMFEVGDEDGDEDGGWAYNYDFEGVPDWATLSIASNYYENEEYTNVRGLHLVWFECEPLPEGVEGRKAVITVVSERGAVCEEKIILRQGILPEDRYEATYAMEVGETHPSGESVEVANALDETVATLTFGVAGGADFTAAVADNSVSGFGAYTAGNTENARISGGDFSEGTGYIITPNADGEIEVAVVLEKDAQFFVREDGTALDGYNGLKKDADYKGTFKFEVKAGKKYTIYARNSQLGFYGFNYTITGAIEDGIQLVNANTAADSNAMYNLQGQRISAPARGLYIMNGRKYTAQ